jgi:hypothetical protein
VFIELGLQTNRLLAEEWIFEASGLQTHRLKSQLQVPNELEAQDVFQSTPKLACKLCQLIG